MSLTPSSRAARAGQGNPPSTRTTATLAYISACFLTVGGLVLISDSIAMRQASHHSYKEFKSLNSTVLSDIWVARRHWASLRVLGDFIECLSIVSAVPPVMVLSDVIHTASRGAGSARLIFPLFVVVALTMLLSFLQSAGRLQRASWVTTFPPFKSGKVNAHLQDGGWGPMQSVEVAWQISSGDTFWTGTFDQLLLSFFYGIVGYHALKNPVLSSGTIHRCHALLSLAISVLTFLTFAFGILRFVNWVTFMILGAITGILSALILMPIWMIALGRHMQKLSSMLKYDDLGEKLMTSSAISIDLPSLPDTSNAGTNV